MKLYLFILLFLFLYFIIYNYYKDKYTLTNNKTIKYILMPESYTNQFKEINLEKYYNIFENNNLVVDIKTEQNSN